MAPPKDQNGKIKTQRKIKAELVLFNIFLRALSRLFWLRVKALQ